MAWGLHNYHSAYKKLPTQGAGTVGNSGAFEAYWYLRTARYNCKSLSLLVGLTPFIEQQGIGNQISNPSTDGGNWPAMGPSQEQIDYKPWATEIPTLLCPSDPGSGLPALGRTNYAARIGDSGFGINEGNLTVWLHMTSTRVSQSNTAHRGAFVLHREMKFRDILDGLSNAIAMGEIVTDLGDNDARTISLGSAGGANPWIIPATVRILGSSIQHVRTFGDLQPLGERSQRTVPWCVARPTEVRHPVCQVLPVHMACGGLGITRNVRSHQ